MLFFPLTAALAAEADPEVIDAEQVLKANCIATDGPALLEFFRARTPSEERRGRLIEAVRQLGAPTFAVREKASRDLRQAGRAARPLLRAVLEDSDLELARRAQRILEAMDRSAEPLTEAAAARLLAARRPPETIGALLAYIPSAPEESVEEAVLLALLAVGLREGKVDPLLTGALADKEPLRRAAAAYVVGRAAAAERQQVKPLMGDQDLFVRFRAAEALVLSGEKSAVLPLIAFLTEGPKTLAWQVEDILALAAGDQAPSVWLGSAEDSRRRLCRDAWQNWWRTRGEKVELTGLVNGHLFQGLNVICDCNVGANGQGGCVWEMGMDGKPRWSIKDIGAPSDVQVLPGGRVLIAEFHSRMVTERDHDGKVLWSQRVGHFPTTCQRLVNGNTFIGTYHELTEVTPSGQVLYTIRPGGNIYRARKLRNGHVLFVHSEGRLIEAETTGKYVRTIPIPGGAANWAGVEPLPNGRYLVALYQADRVVELDAGGKIVWECKVQKPSSARRLPNGRTLVSSMDGHSVVEFDRSGRQVWKQATQGRPFCVVRH
jgi:outer membrane protein assembly factor BamB